MKCSLGISHFLEEISSFPFCCFPLFALITEEGFLISPCYSLELCIQMFISFLSFFAFSFSSFLSYLQGLLRHLFCFLHFLYLHWSLKKAFLSLLAILWNSAFRCLYLSFSPLLSASLLFTAICKASPDSHFAFLHFFSMRMVLIPISCTMSQTSVHSSSGTLSDLGP